MPVSDPEISEPHVEEVDRVSASDKSCSKFKVGDRVDGGFPRNSLRNSARNQMAEGFLRYLAGDLFEVFSAGIEADELHPPRFG